MRDEPEGRFCFQYGMSLTVDRAERGYMLLVNDNHHGKRRAVDPDRDAGVCRRQWDYRVCCRGARGGVRVHRRGPTKPAVPAAEQGPEGHRAAIPGESHWGESSPGDPLDPRLDGERSGNRPAAVSAAFSA